MNVTDPPKPESFLFCFTKFCLSLIVIMAVSSCSSFSKRTTSEDEPAHNPAQIDWTKEFTPPAKARSNTDESLQSDDQKQPKPHFKSLSPLDTERVNLSFVKENAAQVLQLLAHTAGLNLVLADAVGELAAGQGGVAEEQDGLVLVALEGADGQVPGMQGMAQQLVTHNLRLERVLVRRSSPAV